MSLRHSRRHRPPRCGAAVVEFAIVAPLLFLLVLGMLEFGRGFMVKHALTNSARSVCRAAIVDGATQTELLALASASLAGTGIDTYNVVFNPDPVSSAAGNSPVTVTIDTNYADVSWLPFPQFLQGMTLSGSCSLPHE